MLPTHIYIYRYISIYLICIYTNTWVWEPSLGTQKFQKMHGLLTASTHPHIPTGSDRTLQSLGARVLSPTPKKMGNSTTWKVDQTIPGWLKDNSDWNFGGFYRTTMEKGGYTSNCYLWYMFITNNMQTQLCACYDVCQWSIQTMFLEMAGTAGSKP